MKDNLRAVGSRDKNSLAYSSKQNPRATGYTVLFNQSAIIQILEECLSASLPFSALRFRYIYVWLCI